MRSLKQPLAAAALGVAWLALMTPAGAQTGMSPSPQMPGRTQSQSPAAKIPDQKLDAAAAAIERVADLQQNYQQQMATAQPDQKPRIASEANGALRKAVTDQGLSIDEYNNILDTAQNDPAVARALVQRIHPPGNSGSTTAPPSPQE